MRACRRCPRVVPGSAVPPLVPPGRVARLLFIGEAPGRLGAGRTGVPFHGDEAGRRFARFLAGAGLSLAEMAVTNAVLCLPLDARGRNRPPGAGEVANCSAWLAAAIAATDPAVVVPLGRTALAALERLAPHGLALREAVARPVPWEERWLFPLYHPGARSQAARAFDLQLDDWRRLGEFVRALPGGHP